jgi:FAD/FMN-containing dehydrogenase
MWRVRDGRHRREGRPGGHRRRRARQRVRPWSTGVYSRFISDSDEGAAGVETAYGQRLARLTALKDRYDPDNVFRLNANIPPTARRAQALVR